METEHVLLLSKSCLVREFQLSLHKCVSNVYLHFMTKDSGFRIRVQRELREKFLEICRGQDRPAAQVLREFMREYVAAHEVANDETPLSHKNKKKGYRD